MFILHILINLLSESLFLTKCTSSILSKVNYQTRKLQNRLRPFCYLKTLFQSSFLSAFPLIDFHTPYFMIKWGHKNYCRQGKPILLEDVPYKIPSEKSHRVTRTFPRATYAFKHYLSITGANFITLRYCQVKIK